MGVAQSSEESGGGQNHRLHWTGPHSSYPVSSGSPPASPQTAQRVQSPRESLSLSLPSALGGIFPLPRKFFLSLGFRDPPVSLRPNGLPGELLMPSALGQPGACFSPLAPRLRGLCLTLWSHRLRGFDDIVEGAFSSSREVEQAGSRCG